MAFWDISRADSYFLLIALPLFGESFETEKIDTHRSGMERLFMTIFWQLDNSKIREGQSRKRWLLETSALPFGRGEADRYAT